MYAILNFSGGWLNATELTRISNAIAALVSGSSLASVGSSELVDSTRYVPAKSTRISTRSADFWTRSSSNSVNSPCGTIHPKTKHVRFDSTSTSIGISLANNGTFVNSAVKNILTTGIGLIQTSSLNVHVYCNENCIVVGFVQENASRPASFSVVSEITYGVMPYMDDANNFIPVVLSNLLGNSPKFVGAVGETSIPFVSPGFISNLTTGAAAPAGTNLVSWRVGNVTTLNQPIINSVGNSRLDATKLNGVEAVLPLGVASISDDTLFVGSITDKTGIYVFSGPGYPSSSNSKTISPDMVIEVNGNNYIVLDRLAIPFA
jgi:hypothetical protein